jgi:uncharacterized protein YndB with AHSA1/START domain
MSESAVQPDVEELTLEREFPHPPEAVFRAWTETDALRAWMGPGEVTAPDSEIDPRVGGRLTIPMVNPDGKVHAARGEILELVPNRRLRFTWAWDQQDGSAGQRMEIALDFEPTATGTRLVFRQTNFIDAEARAQHQKGWDGCLDKLGAYLDG